MSAVVPATDLEAFRAEAREWLAAATPPVLSPVYEERFAALREWQRRLHAAGWVGIHWPERYGGRGLTMRHTLVFAEELARSRLPQPVGSIGLEVVGPTILGHGSDELRDRLLPPLLSGEELWCQGFSEPDAGSDLPALRTAARLDGDEWVVNGRKIWTSWAKYAGWCLLLARTGTPESRHRGLTALIVDMDDPGIEVSPIVQANGTDELAEVTFDDVRVPADRIVGDVDGGWAVALHILSSERGTYAWFRHGFLYQQLRELADGGPERNDTAVGNALLDLAAVTATGHGGVVSHADDEPLGARATFTKLLLCNAEQAVQDAALAVDTDLASAAQTPEVAMRRQEYLFSRIVTIYGGSQQMQLDTIAKQILRLP
jgi:alkylation response protein AidB-like acyl-CoA dehydrogenase